MKQWVCASACFVMSMMACADTLPIYPKVLDTVELHMAAKEWVSTQTALLTVSLNATLTSGDLVKARADILDKLSKIAPGSWHLIQFDRSQDGSGLEKLMVQAQARVAQTQLTHVYQNAKAVSKPGETYSVVSLEFKPSLEDVQQVRVALRERLYQQVQDELVRLNTRYDGQHYSLNKLVFVEGDDVPSEPKARGMMMAAAQGVATPALTISNELVMTVFVELASTRS